MMSKKYRKKPVVIEAVQLKKDSSWNDMLDFLIEILPDTVVVETTPLRIKIPTLEGVMTASEGDYIIKGIKGEVYPCKPDIFEATYEEVKDD